MEPEPPQDKNVDEVLDEINWEELGVEGAEEKAELVVPAETQPPPPGETQPPSPAKTQPPPPARTEPSPPDRMQPPPPAQVQLFRRESELEIVHKWLGWQTLLVTALTAIWGWFTFRTLGALIEDRNLLGLLFSVVGVLLVYYTLARWLNRTRIVVSRDKITVRHGPLPWPGNKKLEASNCRQFYRDEKEYRGSKGGTTRIYEVYAATRDGRSVKLLDGFTGLTSDQAFFIAQQLEEYLGIRRSAAEGGLFDWLD